ncbi:MAG TPA: M28 family peptidase [Bryobacteraceae bacterium]|nr:M28 family peptidase [Bryobacteraceae bacterium]
MRKPVFLAAAALAVVAAAQTASSKLDIIRNRLSANDLRADISFLASDALEGRGTPSRGLDVAAEYIAAQFRRAGLEPAGDDGYFQTANYVNVKPNAEGMEFAVETGGATVKAKANGMGLMQAAAVDLTGAAVVKAAGSDAAAVTALTPDQVRGKVLVLDFPPGTNPMMVRRQLPGLAARLQPALVVILRSGTQPTNRTTALREVMAASPPPVLVVWDEEVRTALGAGRPEPVNATVSVHIAAPESTAVKLHNVVGLMRGSDPALRDTYVLVTAHYDHLGIRGTGEGDHIYNGANDDGSGTASVIEVANALAALPTRPKRSIVFMTFFGEELGLVGSRYYGAHPIFPLAKTVADLNLEQLGRTDVDGGSSVGLVNVTGFDFSTLTDAVVKAGNETGLQVVKNAELNERYFAQSDNQAMADAGVPAHTLSVGYMFPDYHQAGDEWTKIDYDNLALVDRTVAVAVYEVADSSETPQWKDLPQTERYRKARQESGSKN